MMEDDEGFAPNCNKCKTVRGFIELLDENVTAYELYNLLNSKIVQSMGMQDMVWQHYLKEASQEGFISLLTKFDVIDEIAEEFKKARARPVKR